MKIEVNAFSGTNVCVFRELKVPEFFNVILRIFRYLFCFDKICEIGFTYSSHDSTNNVPALALAGVHKLFWQDSARATLEHV